MKHPNDGGGYPNDPSVKGASLALRRASSR